MSDFDKEFCAFISAAQDAANGSEKLEELEELLSEYRKGSAANKDTLVSLAEELFRGRELESLAERLSFKGEMLARQLPEGIATEVVAKESIFVGEAYGESVQFTPVLQLSLYRGMEDSQLVLRPASPLFRSDISSVNWGAF